MYDLNAVRLKVTLAGIMPPIWRELVVPTVFTLDKLHLVLQAAFGWTESHLHEFLIGGLRYGNLEHLDDEFGGPRAFDEREVSLSDFVGPNCTFTYIYDFGDYWQHEITIIEWLAQDPAPKHAQCVAGARARPPEDVGGTSGYADFLETIADPEHDDHAPYLRWAGGHFDPEWFDMELINKDLRNTFRSNVRRRLNQPKPKKM